jgi:hypothetical protein
MKEGCAETEVVSNPGRSSQRDTTSACLRSAQLSMSNSRFVVPEGNIKKGSCGSAASCSAALPVAKFSGIIRAKVSGIVELSEKFVFRKLNTRRNGTITLGIAEESCPVRRRVTVIKGPEWPKFPASRCLPQLKEECKSKPKQWPVLLGVRRDVFT